MLILPDIPQQGALANQTTREPSPGMNTGTLLLVNTEKTLVENNERFFSIHLQFFKP
jgi:hypothetical protein